MRAQLITPPTQVMETEDDPAQHTLIGTRPHGVRLVGSSECRASCQITTTLTTNLIPSADDSASVAGSESTVHEINADAAPRARREEALFSISELLPIEEEAEGTSAGETVMGIDEEVAEEAEQQPQQEMPQ